MANRYFNKQVAESRKPLAMGGMLRKAFKEVKKIKDESKARIREKGRSKK